MTHPITKTIHVDKFISWFRNHGIGVPDEDAQTLLGYITKAEKRYAALAEKEEELKGTTGRNAPTSKFNRKHQKKIRFTPFMQSERQSLWEKRQGTSSGSARPPRRLTD